MTTRGKALRAAAKTSVLVVAVIALSALVAPAGLLSVLAPDEHARDHAAHAALSEGQRPVKLGQTEGWARDRLVVFDYTQNFICANAPLNDADCKVGASSQLNLTQLQLDPARTADLIVIVPFFHVTDGDDPVGDTTVEALDPTPGVFAQCPEKQSSRLSGGTEFGKFGHCILHDTMLDTSPLKDVTVAGVTFGGTIPLPNHTHIVKDTPGGSVPWDTDVVLVLDRELWPDENGNCPAKKGCLTSFEAVDAAIAAGKGVGRVPTTLFLFFGVRDLKP